MTQSEVLTFARCAGFVFRAPGFSHPSVPPALRAGVAAIFSMGLAPTLRAAHPISGIAFIFAIAGELAVGAAIGIAASVLYDGAYAGGRALDDYVGIRGSVPSAAVVAGSGFGRIWSLVFLGGFFLLDGYHIVILVFADSFERLPAGSVVSVKPMYLFAVSLPWLILKAAILTAAPAIALTFVAQVALGALTRVIPRFSSFTLSFPVVFAVALLATLAAVPVVLPLAAQPWLRLPFVK